MDNAPGLGIGVCKWIHVSPEKKLGKRKSFETLKPSLARVILSSNRFDVEVCVLPYQQLFVPRSGNLLLALQYPLNH